MLLEPTKIIEFTEDNFDTQICQLIGNDDHDLFDNVCDQARIIGILATLEGILNNSNDYYTITWAWNGPIELPRTLSVFVSFYDMPNTSNTMNNDDVFIIDDSKNLVVNETILFREVLYSIKGIKFYIEYHYDIYDEPDYVKLYRWTGIEWKQVISKPPIEYSSSDDVDARSANGLIRLKNTALNTENAVQKMIKLSYHFL